LPSGDRLHWIGRDQGWNYQCADCLSTDLNKNYELAANTYASSWTDVDVSCEACHGPGSRHLAWANSRQSQPTARKMWAVRLHFPMAKIRRLQPIGQPVTQI